MTVKESKHYRFESIEFFAKNGRVYMIDLRQASKSDADVSNQVKTVAPGELMRRAIAIHAAIGMDPNSKPEELFRSRQMLERATEVAKIAWFQGDPTRASTLAYVSRHRRKSSALFQDPAASLPPLAGIKYKLDLGKPRDMLLGGVDVKPDFSIAPAQLLTPSRAEALRRKR